MTASLNAQEATRRIELSLFLNDTNFSIQVALGVLTGLTLLCFLKHLRLDDTFLIFAAASLIAATGILYHIRYFLYLHSAALLDPEVLPYVLSDYNQLLGCFLAFMRPLVWHISRGVNWYYWFIVIFCIISWAFAVAEPFVICPYFGVEAIVSVPIIILRNSLLSTSTKFGLAIFLCISIFMAILAIVRISGFYYNGLEDDIWEFFWQETEGGVAVMMASITAFRMLFVKQRGKGRVDVPEAPHSTFKLPEVPSPILTGIRTFIRKNNSNGASVATFATLESVCDDSNADYHVAIKAQTRLASSNTHRNGSS
ncbi:hypothetical protein F4782DRAFT_541992 [Xylaria castorea]|nr:hypothetical protein F4782DRAFT_541992 [Xylaria castorea]